MPSIEAHAPGNWKLLQMAVARVLTESGLEVKVEYSPPHARGSVRVDVWSRETSATTPYTTIYECKLWDARVPQTVVHAFRSVMADTGANAGVLLSPNGFQIGALQAAQLTNVELLTWTQFEERWLGRWYRKFFAAELEREADALIEYTEFINSRIARKQALLSSEAQDGIRQLVRRHEGLGFLVSALQQARPAGVPPVEGSDVVLRKGLELPLRGQMRSDADLLPAPVLDATAFRPLLEATLAAAKAAIAEFDEAFGGRA